MPKFELLQGTLDMLILKVLRRGPLHGFGIAERIQQLSQDVLSVGEGSLYPALYRLQDRGWIQSEWGQSENNRRPNTIHSSGPGANNWKRKPQAGSRCAPRSRKSCNRRKTIMNEHCQRN